jgi:SAM-dependent methyltransferase
MGDSQLGQIATWKDHHGVVVASTADYDVITCETCGFRHVVPLPTAEELADAYSAQYYTQEKPNYLAEANKDQRWAELMQNDRLAALENALGPGRRRLLDIGSGPGFFVKTAQDRGWQALGIEPSQTAAAFARKLGVRVVETFFDAQSAPKLGEFDAVHLNNVLEHIPDPAALLSLARQNIAPGGLICINVPNDFTPFQVAGRDAAGAQDWWVAPPHHLNYFDFASAAALLERLGFRILERTTSFPMELFLMMGENYIGHPETGRACHQKRMNFDLALETCGQAEARRKFYGALAEAGIGREVVLLAVKE